MKKMIAILTGILMILACDNPFGADEIAGENRALKGVVKISGLSDHSGVYVWLEGVNIGVLTDENGAYTLTLPPGAALGTSGEVNGEFTVYYYSINYNLVTRKVVLKNGALLYGKGDLDKSGRLRDVQLSKTFTIRTQTAFPDVSKSDSLDLSITAHFSATLDSFAIELPGATMYLLGGLFLKNLQSGEIYTFSLAGREGMPYTFMLARREHLWSFHPDIWTRGLPVGRYRVYPFVYPYYEDLPRDLLESFGVSRFISVRYLDLLMTGDFAEFRKIE